jgi:hypothetical protein
MAQKRMFSLKIVDTDAFLDMPTSSQLLYFHLSMRADDEGFVGNPKKIMRMGGFTDDDFKVLTAKRFILAFESGVVVIKHWLIHNTIQKDRLNPTTYQKEKKQLEVKENKAYTECIQNVSKMDTQIRLDKTRLDKIRLDKNRLVCEQSSQDIKRLFEIFYKINPTINWGNKTSRKAAAEIIKHFGIEDAIVMANQIVSVQGKKYAPTCTTPYQMKEKLAEFKIYFDKEKDNKPLFAKI